MSERLESNGSKIDVNRRRIAEVTQQVRSDRELVQQLVKCALGGAPRVAIADSHLSHFFTDVDARSVKATVLRNILEANLTTEQLNAIKDNTRHKFTQQDLIDGAAASREASGKTTFNRDEEVRGIEARGLRPWTDDQEKMLVKLANKPKYRTEWKDGRVVVDWKSVTEQMNAKSPGAEFHFVECCSHYVGIRARARKGTYGRGIRLPENVVRPAHSQIPSGNGAHVGESN